MAAPDFTLFFFFFWDRVSLCRLGWSAVVQSQFTAASVSWVQAILASQLQVCATMPSWFFVILVEMGVHHVGQAGLELLTSSDPSALASQSARITGTHDHAWLIFVFLIETGFHHVGQAGWSRIPDLKWSICLGLPKCWGYRREPRHQVFLSYFFFSWDRVSLCHSGWSAVVQTGLTAASTSLGSGDHPPALASRVAGIIGSYHYAQLIFVFFCKDGVLPCCPG